MSHEIYSSKSLDFAWYYKEWNLYAIKVCIKDIYGKDSRYSNF